jgi:outer membrane receptor for ferrienterochelin and colicins
MKKPLFTILLILLFLSSFSQKEKTDANIVGHVLSHGHHIPFVAISISGTTMGATTDETGHYQLINLPFGTYKIKAQSVGYKYSEKEVHLKKGETIELNFELEEDVLGLDEIVVTGDRNEKSRKDASVIVNTLTPKLFNAINSVTLSEGLNFSPGLRIENNCQNCGFNQVRMNGMEGPYSQILINGRAIFSGLAGVYGLELIPANMLERIEVVRGGGSALYGSNAIAGTINLILKDPINNTYEFGASSNFVGVGLENSIKPSQDYVVNANASLVSSDKKTGLAIYGFYRDHEPFDANGDGFSEISKIQNTTFGSRLFHRFGMRNKVSVDFFNIKEDRRGGNKFEYLKHESDIAEAVTHDITTAAITYEQYFRDYDLFSTYFSGQRVNRDSYYGANQSLKDYGFTSGLTYTIGGQYNMKFSSSNLILGIENREEWLKDTKLGYPDFENAEIIDTKIIEIPHTENTIVANQKSNIIGAMAQYEFMVGKLNTSVGGRFDYYQISDTESGANKDGKVFSPRITMKYEFIPEFQARASYSQGYRAPQIFDEDLHIETSGSRQVLHENAPDLRQETSHSIMASLDFNKQLGSTSLSFLAEGFYTKLNDAFVNEYGEIDEKGVVVYTRTNAEKGATVQGVNMELNVIPSRKLSIKSGFTLQKSQFEEEQEFGEKRFFRTPGQYGFITLDWKPLYNLGISSSANYTGKMLVPYFGPTLEIPENGELRQTNPFFDMGIKVRYNIKLNGASLQLFGGVKNILNSYQNDFDAGIDRDPGYMYGPNQPRTIYLGIKLGNMLN